MAQKECITPLHEALAVVKERPGHLKAKIPKDYCYGDWGCGGFLASLISAAASKNSHEDARRSLHDVMNMQIQFVRPVQHGAIDISISTITASKSMSIVNVALSQNGRDCVLGYINLADLESVLGPTFETEWELHPPLKPVDLSDLEHNQHPDWVRFAPPYSPEGFFRLWSVVDAHLPILPTGLTICDEWITPRDGQTTFTNDSLALFADLWCAFWDNERRTGSANHFSLVEIAQQQRQDPNGGAGEAFQRNGWTSPYILKTLSMTLEVKKRLPPQGVKWLFVRAYPKSLENGKLDIEVIIMDEKLSLVALSHQTALIVRFQGRERDTDGSRGSTKL